MDGMLESVHPNLPKLKENEESELPSQGELQNAPEKKAANETLLNLIVDWKRMREMVDLKKNIKCPMYDGEGQSRRQRRTAQMTATASEAVTADVEGFKGSDGRRRGLQRQRRQMARDSEAATVESEGFRGSDGRRRWLQRQRRRDDTTSGRHHENSTPDHQSCDDAGRHQDNKQLAREWDNKHTSVKCSRPH
ncbi:hypothetical protein Syun_011889 [Stephania yunnanensis]|uniref:Uncharacterized protein n=1 Tax=Stephania yunnanensis TaxID=152371 RepID=A0AAP0JZ56_9MAGN